MIMMITNVWWAGDVSEADRTIVFPSGEREHRDSEHHLKRLRWDIEQTNNWSTVNEKQMLDLNSFSMVGSILVNFVGHFHSTRLDVIVHLH